MKRVQHSKMFRGGFIIALLVIALSVLGAPREAQAACSNPTGAEGRVIYNTDYHTMQFCNGTNWISAGGGNTSGTSMVTNWPDAIVCNVTNPAWGVVILYAELMPFTGDGKYYYRNHTNGTNNDVIFTSAGAFSAYNTLVTSDCNTTISALQAAGKTFNFVGGAGSGGGSASAADVTGAIQFNGGSSAFAGDASTFFWDNTNKALGIGTNTPSTKAVLDLTSTTKGFLPPRMTTTQRDAITSPATALIIFNTTSGQLEFYNGTAWTGIGSLTTGTIAAFAATSCPAGWTAYTPAYGRFLRGIDPTGATTNDPRGTVAPGTLQADDLIAHTHTVASRYGAASWNGGSVAATDAGGSAVGSVTSSTGGTETRPRNVAVIYCQFSGSGSTSSLVYATATDYRANTGSKPLDANAIWNAAAFVALTDGASIAVDMGTGLNFTVTLAGNRTLANPTNVKSGQTGVIRVQQDATGTRTLAYGTSYKFAGGAAPTLTVTANAVDYLFYLAYSSTEILISATKDVK